MCVSMLACTHTRIYFLVKIPIGPEVSYSALMFEQIICLMLFAPSMRLVPLKLCRADEVQLLPN
jgi:hypothetical protein